MELDHEPTVQVALHESLLHLAEQTEIREESLRRSFIVEQLVIRLLADPPDRWVRYDDLRLEYRHDGSVAAPNAAESVSAGTRAAVDRAV